MLSHTAGLDPSRDALNADELALLGRRDNLEDTIIRGYVGFDYLAAEIARIR